MVTENANDIAHSAPELGMNLIDVHDHVHIAHGELHIGQTEIVASGVHATSMMSLSLAALVR
jgi:hypothetical protein